MVQVDAGGSLSLGDQVSIEGYRSTGEASSPVRNAGELLIDGATISGNAAYAGGGVYNEGTMDLRSGEVSGNTAQHSGGGIYNMGTLLISGGRVDDNETTDAIGDVDGKNGTGVEAQGGGVWNSNTLRMTGGSVSGNHSDSGGGVYNSGTFEMAGGTIAKNDAHALKHRSRDWTTLSGEGGGVYTRGTFRMIDGLLSGNNALSRGGGISVPEGEMTLSGGVILDNTVEGPGYYAGAGGATFFKACGIYSRGGVLQLEGGTVKSSDALTDEVLISSYFSTEVSGAFTLEGGMLWVSDQDNSGASVDGLPIRVTSALSADLPIEVFSVPYSPDTVIATYSDGIQPDVTDFALGDFGANPYIYSGEDTLRIEGQSLVLTRPHEVIAAGGWERNGTCEQRLDEDGTLTVRPINGARGALQKTFVDNEDIINAVFEDGVSLLNTHDNMFYGCENLESADLSGIIDVTSTVNMFVYCKSLKSVTLPDLPSLQYAHGMFHGCSSLAAIDTSVFANAKLLDASFMFCDCSSLESIDMTNIDTSRIADLSGLLYGCSSLVTVECSGLDTSHMTNAAHMFSMCSSLENLDVSSWDVSQAESMEGMFSGYTSLASLDVSDWDTSSVLDMSYMFHSCESLMSLDVASWNTSSVNDMSGMFDSCSKLRELDVDAWDTSMVTTMENMFQCCRSLNTLNLSGWTTSSVKAMRGLFSNGETLTSLDLSSWDVASVKDMGQMFQGCVALRSIDLSGWNTSSLSNMDWMFASCNSLSSLDLSNFRTAAVDSFAYMLTGCSSLSQLQLGALNTSKVTDMQQMLSGCSKLTSLDLSMWDTTKVQNFADMFRGCESLKTLDLSGFQTCSAKDMNEMFSGCKSLASVNVSGWETSRLERTAGMFAYCSSLTEIDLSAWDASSLSNPSEMFSGCTAIISFSIPSNWPSGFDGAIPQPTACNRKWWSQADEAWYNNDEIAVSRAGIADTYSNPNGIFGHEYEASVVEPTWDDWGYTRHTCKRCGDEYRTEETEPLKAAAQRAAQLVDDAIWALLPTEALTLEDEAAVVSARAAFDALTDQQRTLVTYYEWLEAAEARIADLRAAETVDGLIDALPAVDALALSDVPDVELARQAYDALTGGQQALVTKLYVLDAAEARIAELRADAEAAQLVDATIAALPDAMALALEDEAKVASARSAYDALTDDQRALVTGIPLLEAAEARLAELRLVPPKVDLSSAEVSASAQTYTGKALMPKITVRLGGSMLMEGIDYTVAFSGNKNAGTAEAIVTGIGSYEGTATGTFAIAKAANPIAAKTAKPSVAVTYSVSKAAATAGNVTVTAAQGAVTYANASTDATAKKFAVDKGTGKVTVPKGTKAATYTVVVRATAAGGANYEPGSATVKYKVVVKKAANPITVKGLTATVSASKAKVASQTLATSKVVKVTKKGQGPVTYRKVSGNAKIAVASSGKVTVKKGLKKGTYNVKVAVTAKGNANYSKSTKTVTFKVVVK